MSEPLPSEDLGDLGLARTRAPQRRQEFFAEENFQGANLNRSVHIGWGATIGAGIIFYCMAMSAFTQSMSWNVSFLWLQRRVGAQFGTLTYIITSNTLFYFDGDKWVTRDWAELMKRWKGKGAAHARGPPLPGTAPLPLQCAPTACVSGRASSRALPPLSSSSSSNSSSPARLAAYDDMAALRQACGGRGFAATGLRRA